MFLRTFLRTFCSSKNILFREIEHFFDILEQYHLDLRCPKILRLEKSKKICDIIFFCIFVFFGLFAREIVQGFPIFCFVLILKPPKHLYKTKKSSFSQQILSFAYFQCFYQCFLVAFCAAC